MLTGMFKDLLHQRSANSLSTTSRQNIDVTNASQPFLGFIWIVVYAGQPH
jgi:hypothetical protein